MKALEYRKMCHTGISRIDLRTQYTKVCNAYRDALNIMWDTDGYWIDDDMWWFDVADCVIGIAEVRLCVDKNIDWDTFIQWYDYDMQVNYGVELGKKAERISLYSWIKGFPDSKKVPEETRIAWEKEFWSKI